MGGNISLGFRDRPTGEAIGFDRVSSSFGRKSQAGSMIDCATDDSRDVGS
jgi:hypothetical protein